MTILDHLIDALKKAAVYNRHDLAKPKVILWTDGERLWEGVAQEIAKARPGFFRLDDSENTAFGGTAVWIRYQLGKWEEREVPVLYLPGISRQDFRGAENLPENDRHLFALQYQGQFFSQSNGRDWTPLAFLSSEDTGLGLDIARDKSTIEALRSQLSHILQTADDSLEGRRIDSVDLNNLAISDPVQMLLQWMCDPSTTMNSWTPDQKQAFRGISKSEFGFEPEKDGLIVAAEKLASGEGKWRNAWTRFEEAPGSYSGVVEALEKVSEKDLFGTSNIRLPSVNRRMESNLRESLKAIGNLPYSQARERLLELLEPNLERSKSVWATLGQAPLAVAVGHLGLMVQAILKGIDDSSFQSLAASYLDHGWIVDAEARKAWVCVQRSEDMQAVLAVISAVYLPWLEDNAQRLQTKASNYPTKGPNEASEYQPIAGTLLLFVDGLRADVSKELAERIEKRGHAILGEPRWSPLPTVTATAKPGWRPMTTKLGGAAPSATFQPSLKETGKVCSTSEFRALLDELGWTLVASSENGDPAKAGWSEVGAIDKHGHDLGAKIVRNIEDEIVGIEERIEELLCAGWNCIRVITDHGWLWMPGGLAKIELPKHLTESRWGRCAWPDPHAKHLLNQVPWFWGNEHQVVLAPGVGAFLKGKEYTHGGLSVQECLTMTLTVTRNQDDGSKKKTSIVSLKWLGLKLQVELSSTINTLRLDIRSKAADADSSLLSPDQRSKGPDNTGKFTIFIENDSIEGQAAVLVVLSGEEVVAKKNITIGEN